MTPKDAWASFFARQKKVKGKEEIHIHTLIVRPEEQFPAGEFYAYDVSHHVYKLVGLNDKGAYLTHAYGFDATKYSEQEARRWVEKFASGLEPEDDTNLLKFKQNFKVIHHTNAETGVKTCDLMGVECAVVGEWNGREYSEADLTRTITNDKEVHRSVKPKFKIEHVFEGPSMGDIENYREGPDGPEHCLCDIYGVPFELYGEITALRYTGLSPEFYRTYVDPTTGKDYDRVFAGLALLGVQTPAMAKMKPLMEAVDEFSMDPNAELICLGQSKPELMKTTAKKATSELMTYGVGASQADEEPDLEDNEMDKKELEALQAKLKEGQDALAEATKANQAKEKELIERDVNSAIKTLISEGRIDPKEVDEQTKNLMALTDENARKAVISALSAVPEGTYSKKEEGTPNPEGDPKKPEESALPPDEQFGELVDKYMKDHEMKLEQYPDALAACENDPRNKELMEKCHKQFEGDAPSDVKNTLG